MLRLRFRRPARLPAHLPRAAARPGRRDALVSLATGAAAFALLHAGLTVAAQSAIVADPLYADKEWRLARIAEAKPGAPPVVFLGTSRVLNGFAAAEAPEPAFNFGIPGSGPVTHALYLRRLLAAGHAPAFVLLEVMPATLADTPVGPAEAAMLAPDRLTRAETELVIDRYGFPAELTRGRRTACDRWPWGAHRFKLLGRLAPGAIPWNLRSDSSRTEDPHGWSPPMLGSAPDPRVAAREAARYRDALRDWRPAPGAGAALRDAFALCRGRGIAAALVLMPESTGFRALYSPESRGRLGAFVADLAAESGCTTIDAREWVADEGFTDGHHLLREGALAFTRRLTAEVLDPFARDRAGRGAP